MKIKFLVLIFMLFLSFFTKAEDKSYIREKADCKFSGAELSLEIRSPDLYALSSERDYGNKIILKHNKEPRPVVMNETDIGRYRILALNNDICSKIMALPINKHEVAFLLLKDNRPFTDQLTILYYNVETKQTEVVSTKVSVKSAFLKDGKVYLRHSKDQPEQKFGTMIMDNVKYNYIEKPFEPWISFDGKHFKTDTEMSFEHFEYKHLLDQKSLLGYRRLTKLTYQIATHRSKTCLSFQKSPWVCK